MRLSDSSSPSHSATKRKSNVAQSVGYMHVYKKRARSSFLSKLTSVIITNYPSDYPSMLAKYGNFTIETFSSDSLIVDFNDYRVAEIFIRNINSGKEGGNIRAAYNFSDNLEDGMRASLFVAVSHFPKTMTLEELTKLFSRFGDIVSSSYKEGSRRVIFEYSSYDQSAIAIESMNNQVILLDTSPIHVSYYCSTRSGKREVNEVNLKKLWT